jgi:hypothetical protein
VQGDIENDFLETLAQLIFVMKDGVIYLDKTGGSIED